MAENPTKKRIVDVALDLFLTEGFSNVTINSICEKSGINKHTFYYYFKSKDDLLKDFYEVPYDISADIFAKIMETDSCIEQMCILLKPLFSFLNSAGVDIAKQIFVKNLTTDVGTFKPDDKLLALMKLQISIVKRGQENGQFNNKSNAEELCKAIHNCSLGYALSWCMFNGKFDYSSAMLNVLENVLDVDAKYRTATPINLR